MIKLKQLTLPLAVLHLAACQPPHSGQSEKHVAASSPGPDVASFLEQKEDAEGLYAGPGCWYHVRGENERIVFKSALSGSGNEIALMNINGSRAALQIDTTVRNFSDQFFRAAFFDATYRVELDMAVDSPSDGGEYQHGEIRVWRAGSSEKTVVPVQGLCGC